MHIPQPCCRQVLDQSRSPKGGLVVKSASGNAAKAGISAGDTVIYTSSFFGEELWPADRVLPIF
jgi:hypothetical protein